VDRSYYLQHQVHAVVARLCEPIQGLEPAMLAECLGRQGFVKLMVEQASWLFIIVVVVCGEAVGLLDSGHEESSSHCFAELCACMYMYSYDAIM